jgi:acyl carrier protein
MTRREFLGELEGQLEIPAGSLDPAKPLNELEGWDSLAAVLLIGLADEKLGVTLSGEQIAKGRTLDDLLGLLGDKLTA